MSNAKSPFSKLSIMSLAVLPLCALSVLANGQAAPPAVRAGGVEIAGIPDDWSHHRVVYSNPGTEAQAIARGRYTEWLKTVNDPRYVFHQLKRGLPVQGPLAGNAARIEAQDAADRRRAANNATGMELRPVKPVRLPPAPRFRKPAPALKPVTDLNQDWNEPMGNTTAPSALAYPAKWSFDTTTASCANDFVVYPTGQAGSGSHASMIAYYNLYTGGCAGTVPETDWAYNTGGTVALSPIFSLTGNELAFIQTSAGTASLVLLQISLTPPGTGTIGSPIAPNIAASASDFYTGTGCSTPCMYSMALSGGGNDTASNPYYDYSIDTLWVGDSLGQLHEFTPVFNGPPAEVASGWPVQLVNGVGTDTSQTASPVYDSLDGNVFVATTTSASRVTSGFLYSIDAATGTIAGASGQLDATNGIRDAPLLDSVAGMLYIFAGRDPTVSTETALYQFATSFTGGSGTEIQFGQGGTAATALQYDGTFDNTYYTSSSPASPTGYIYMCPTLFDPSLYRIPITNNVMGAAVVGPQVGGSAGSRGRCSSITEFYNLNANSGAGADYLLLSAYQGFQTGCTDAATSGCVMSFDVTNPSNWGTGLAPLGTFNVPSPATATVTSGISVDNAAATAGASQMYFLTQNPAEATPCTGICAVQLSQSAP